MGHEGIIPARPAGVKPPSLVAVQPCSLQLSGGGGRLKLVKPGLSWVKAGGADENVLISAPFDPVQDCAALHTLDFYLQSLKTVKNEHRVMPQGGDGESF